MKGIAFMVLILGLAISVGYVVYEENTIERVYIMNE